jgi:hypothetical protein
VNPDRGVLEARLLRALCACNDATQALAADHHVVFAAIRVTLELGAPITQANLISMATRAGFPDVEFSGYLAAGDDIDLNLTVRELERLGLSR